MAEAALRAPVAAEARQHSAALTRQIKDSFGPILLGERLSLIPTVKRGAQSDKIAGGGGEEENTACTAPLKMSYGLDP